MAMIVLGAFMSKVSELLTQMVVDEVGLLLGFPGDMEKLRRTICEIKHFIADAEKKQIQDTTIKDWLMELKDVMYDADDVLDLCQIKANMEKYDCSDSPSSSKKRRLTHYFMISHFSNPCLDSQLATEIKKINSKLEDITKRKFGLGLTASNQVEPIIRCKNDHQLIGMEDIVGEQFEEDASRMVSWLTEQENGVSGNVDVAVIVGTGGIGKTTLAKRMFNDSKIIKEFELTIWACVSKELNEVKQVELLKSIIEQAGGKVRTAQLNVNLLGSLQEAIRGKKFFLVLDDVWYESVWVWNDLLGPAMSAGAPGSKLLVTTRDDRIVIATKATKSHHVVKMSNEDGWTLLSKQVFRSDEDSEIQRFKDIGLELVKKCDGLPLAIKSIGRVLCLKNRTIREWRKLLQSEIWCINEPTNDIHKAFYLSYEDLLSPLKQCFISCSLYPEDYNFHRTDLIYLWLAEGFLQGAEPQWELGKKYYDELLVRNLLENSGKMYDKSESKMHDLWRFFAQCLGKYENCVLREEKDYTRSKNIAKLRRLSLQGNMANLEVVKKEEGLRTLLIANLSENELALDAYICTFRKLRVLDMRFSNILNLPDSLSSLVQLRYLDVRNSKIRSIPNFIGCLRNLLYLNFTNCEELRHVPNSITNLENLMFLSFQGTKVEGIPAGLKRLKKLRELCGFRSNENSSSLDELETLPNLVCLQIECLERVICEHTAEKAKLSCKNELQILYLQYTMKNKESQTNEKKLTAQVVLNKLCPPRDLEYLIIEGYFGGCLPNWLNSGSNFSELRFLEIKDCNYFVNLASLGQLPNLDFLRIDGADSISSVGEEFLWDDMKSRDMEVKSCIVNPAFPKLNKLIFSRMINWEEWHWDKGKPAMPKLKQLYIKYCGKLRTFPEGLSFYATSLEYLEIYDAPNLTIVENFSSVNEIRVFRNTKLNKISNMLSVSDFVINHCPNLKIVERLDALQRVTLVDYEMDALPEYLVTVMTPCKLTTYCREELKRKIANEGEGGSERRKFKHIPKVTIYSRDDQEKPLSFTTNITA